MSTLNKTALAVLMLCLAGASAVPAQSSDYGVPSDDWGYTDPDIRQTVARLGYVSGDVSFARGDDPDEWQPADANVPMTLGDRVWTSGGRLELQVHGGSYIRLANSTDLTALNLTDDTKQFSISAGVASFRVPRLADDEVYEVDTPNAAVTFERTGDYRIDVRPNGDTRVQVRSGRAVVASAGGQVPLAAGTAMVIEGSEPPRYDVVGMPHPDGWDGWVRDRDARFANVQSYNYVSPDIAGAEDLDQYGRWQQVPSYGWAWTPTRVAVGWQPYRVGRWIWQDPWGWTWVSTEPWGWAPYHYGRWVTVSSNWYWIPVAPRVPVVAYSPALVAFVGGGPGFSVSVGVGANYVGWFPLAPRDPFVPWWGRPTTVVNVTNVTYVNQTYVTVVNQNTFVTSQVVNTNYVRDQNIVRRVESSPVVRGQVPVAPTRESIRVTTRQARAVRPPANIAQRSVVSHVAPPPAPPRFDTKMAVIREQKRPVTTVEAQRIVARDGRTAQPARAVRPASQQDGRNAFQSKTANSTQPKAEPIAPARGRTLATKEQPAAPSRENSAQRGRPAATQRDTQPDARQQSSSQQNQEKEQADRDQAARDQRDKALQQDRAQQEQNQREQADRLQQQRVQAQKEQQEKQQREQAQRDQRDREQVQRDQAQREQDQRERVQREQAERDQRDRQPTQQDQRDQQEKQQVQRDRARQEQLERQEAQRQQDQRDQLERQQAKQDDARRDQVEQQQREQQERQKAQRDQAQREQAQRQQNEKQQVQRQPALRPTARPAPDEPQRSEARESNANPNPNRPQPEHAQPDRQDKDKDKEKPANSPPQRGRRPTPKPTPDKNS